MPHENIAQLIVVPAGAALALGCCVRGAIWRDAVLCPVSLSRLLFLVVVFLPFLLDIAFPLAERSFCSKLSEQLDRVARRRSAAVCV